MKCFVWLTALVLLSTAACSEKESAPQQPAQTDAAPQSKYGKAMKAAEDVTAQREVSSKELDKMMAE